MASRSLTDVFLLMRNNALQSKHLLNEQSISDHVRLLKDEASIPLRSVDIELGDSYDRVGNGESHEPPAWSDALEETQYIISRLRSKITELEKVHARHLQRPTLDDSCVEEQQASRLTSEISRHFSTAHRIVHAIKEQCHIGSQLERRLASNVLSSLVITLQELSLHFRSSQNNYLRSLTSREERSNAFFELPNFDDFEANDVSYSGDVSGRRDPYRSALPSTSAQTKNSFNSSAFFEEEDRDIDEAFQKPSGSRMTQQQLVFHAEENTKVALHREQEVNKIVTSIVELNDIFKDLAHMVKDQGTVLDRIDYNIERTHVSVNEGYKQLQKAEGYQKKNRKMHCICCLGITIIILIMLLMIVKT